VGQEKQPSSESKRGRLTNVGRYIDPAFAALEVERVFRRAWLMVGLVNQLGERGDYLTFDELGESIVVLRDGEGALRAFHNTCRHRGTRLLEGTGNVQAIRCPYHDWKYALDGRLRHVPDAGGFEELDRAKLHLFPVRVDAWGGFVFINLSEEEPQPLAETMAPLMEELEPYGLEDMIPIEEHVFTVPCNWKALLDNATESYHLPFVHKGSVDPHVATRPEFKTFGEHYRLTLGIADYWWRRWVDEQCSRRGPYSDKQLSSLHKYVAFPNFLFNVLPYHLTIFRVYPVDVNTCRFHYGFYKRKGASGLEWMRAYATWVASRYILLEDFKVLEAFQKGAVSGRNATHRFHAGEIAISHFHKVLSRWTGVSNIR
jgi:choline monooxygenase